MAKAGTASTKSTKKTGITKTAGKKKPVKK